MKIGNGHLLTYKSSSILNRAAFRLLSQTVLGRNVDNKKMGFILVIASPEKLLKSIKKRNPTEPNGLAFNELILNEKISDELESPS